MKRSLVNINDIRDIKDLSLKSEEIISNYTDTKLRQDNDEYYLEMTEREIEETSAQVSHHLWKIIEELTNIIPHVEKIEERLNSVSEHINSLELHAGDYINETSLGNENKQIGDYFKGICQIARKFSMI